MEGELFLRFYLLALHHFLNECPVEGLVFKNPELTLCASIADYTGKSNM